MSSRGLFRQEALEFQQHRGQLGSVASLQPVSTKVTCWFLVLSVVAIVDFLFIGKYSRKATAVGYLTPSTGTARIFVPQPGTIERVDVDQGERVRKGQPLLTVDTEQITGNGIDVNASMLDTLLAEKGTLSKSIRQELQRADSERERLEHLISGLETQIAEIKNQIQDQVKRIEVAESELRSADKLTSKGLISATAIKQRQLQLLEQRQSMSSLKQQLAAEQNELIQKRYTLQQLPTVIAQNVQNLRDKLSDTEERIAETSGRRAYVLRAPVSGRISTLQATVGQNADPKRLQLEIIPDGGVLEAQLFVPPQAIGFVNPGQAVRILYDAFPYQHFGTYSGHVVEVSQTLLTNADVVGPIALARPAYRVTVALDRENVDADGKKVALQPDMLLTADIILEKRSLFSWLTGPLTGMRL